MEFSDPIFETRINMGNPSLQPPLMDTSFVKRKWVDVPYAPVSPTQKLDIYLPNEDRGPFPVIVLIHGGAFASGRKDDILLLPWMRGLTRGYAIVSIDYRLSGEAIFPAQIHDCKAAVRFIKAKGEKYGLDREKIGLWGASAGGHLCSLVATSAWARDLEDLSMGNAREDCSVRAVVDICGPSDDFIAMDEQFKASKKGVPDHSQPESPESRLMGRTITEIPEKVRAASPKTYVTKDTPHFLIQHGTEDHLVPVEQSVNFAVEVRKAAGPDRVILEVLEGVSHHGDPYYETVENVAKVFGFFDEHVK